MPTNSLSFINIDYTNIFIISGILDLLESSLVASTILPSTFSALANDNNAVCLTLTRLFSSTRCWLLPFFKERIPRLEPLGKRL